MGRILAPYPDLESAVMDLIVRWYPDEFHERPGGDWRVGGKWPDNVQDIIAAGDPVCRVKGIGGNDDGLTDRPLIDVDILASTFAEARDLSVGIQARLLGYPWRVGTTVIDKVRTAMRPHDVPWDDDNIFRFYSSYVVSARR